MARDKEKLKEYNKIYRVSHLDYFANYMKQWRNEHPERMKELQKASYIKSKDKRKARDKIYSKEYRQKNKKLIQAKDSIRHLAKKNRFVNWADQEEIKRIYKECPINHHVDHIIPLNGNVVCGLHVEYNLQYLTPEENISKSNIFPHPEFHFHD